MKLWLDDLRPVPCGYEGAKSVNEAKQLIREAEHNGIEIEVLDLDHDLGEYADQVEVIARGNLLYNEALLAQSNMGAVIGMKLNCQYEGLKFIPFSPVLESGTALVWKKEQMFPATVLSFIDFMKKYIKSMTEQKK